MSTQKDPKTGKWNVQYWYTDWTGKRKHSVKRGFNTKRDADEWLSSFQNRKGSKLNISFGDFVEIYFEDMEVRLRKSTILSKRYLFNSKILPYFKDKRMDEITVSDIRHYTERIERAGFRVVYTYHGIQLKACVKRRKYREYSPELVEDIRRLDKYISLQNLCRKYRLDTPEDVEDLKTRLREEISRIAEERDECRKQVQYWERHDAPGYVDIWKIKTQEKTKQMRPLYRELRMCEEVLKTGPMARMKAIALVQQRVKEEQWRQLRKDLEKTRPQKKPQPRCR